MNTPAPLDPDAAAAIRRSAQRHNRRFLVMSVVASVAVGAAVVMAAFVVALLNTDI